MVLNFHKICRLCMTEGDDLWPLFDGKELFDKVKAVVPRLKLAEGDGLPTQVCQHCIEQLNASYSFQERCASADSALRQLQSCNLAQKPLFIDEDSSDADMKNEYMTMKRDDGSEVIGVDLVETIVKEEAEDLDSFPENVFRINPPKVVGDNNVYDRKLGEVQKSLVCEVCGKAFKQTRDLRRHMLTHMSEKPFACAACPKSFTTKDALKSHSRVHTGEKPYSCEECGSCFRQLSALASHRKTHTGERRFQCIECGRRFTRLTHLHAHLVCHTGEKAFECPECPKAFGRRDSLMQHLRTHKGQRPYLCTTCGKSFSQGQQLKVHIATHAANKPFACTQCDKSFAKKDRLKDHLVSHTGQRPYICHHCTKGFVRSDHLKYHLTHMHKAS